MTLGVLAFVTLVRGRKRNGGITLISLLTFGNLWYGGLTLVIAFYWPSSAYIFNAYVNNAGMNVDEEGLVNALLLVTIFQFGLLISSFCINKKRHAVFDREVLSTNNMGEVAATIKVGSTLFFAGLLGAVWLGFNFNGSFFGLFDITYIQRSQFLRENPLPAFLMFIGFLGVVQLMAISIIINKVKAAILLLLFILAYSVATSSKLPLFWGLVVFVVSATNGQISLRNVILPVGISILFLIVLSHIRSGFPFFEALLLSGFNLWNNDIPGPASISYFVVNSTWDGFDLEPLISILRVLVPSFLVERGALLPDIWAEKMAGVTYEYGQGFGWSVLLDTYLLAGYTGVLIGGFLLGNISQAIDFWRVHKTSSILYSLFTNCIAPIFLLFFRESIAGGVKGLLIISLVVFLPTILVANYKGKNQ